MEQTVVKANPLGTERIGKLMVRFAVPSIIALVLNSLYNMVDQVFIGNGVGYLGNAATNVILPIMTVVPAVFPAGLIAETDCGRIKAKIFFEIMAKDQADASIERIAAGTFLCRRIDLTVDVKFSDAIKAVYGNSEKATIVVSNMLLDKYQIGTKKSELQKRILV